MTRDERHIARGTLHHAHDYRTGRKTRREQPDILFFCNISNKTLTDIEFFTDFIDFMANNTSLASSLIFEFSQQTIEDGTFEIQTNLKRPEKVLVVSENLSFLL